MRRGRVFRSYAAISLVTAMMVLGLAATGLGAAPGDQAPEGQAPEFDSTGTIMIIPLDVNVVGAAKEFVQQVQTSSVLHVSATVYAPPGIAPKLVMSGGQDDLRQALEIFRKLVPQRANRHLVVISAALLEIKNADKLNVGVNAVPVVGATSTFNWGRNNDGSHSKNNAHQVTGTWTDAVALNDALSKSKVLVSSEVYTPSGVKAQISDVQSVPTFSADNNGNVQTQYQNLETSINVIPTVLKFDGDKPEESQIRVDVDVKVSIISGDDTFKSVSAPEYSVKTMTTTRVLNADGKSYVIGAFTTDSNIKNVSGIPLLGKLPLLKYLFSQEYTQRERNTAVLTLSVRLLPVPPSK